MRKQTFWCTFCSILILLSLAAQAQDLGGRTVLLVLTQNELPETDRLRQTLKTSRAEIGMSSSQMPIFFMTVAGSETERTYAQRLGINPADVPVLCVVEWAEVASNGPKRVLDGAIIRRASVNDVDSALVRYLKVTRTDGQRPISEMDPYSPGLLTVENHRFEVSGKPYNTLDASVRIRNVDERPLKGIAARFYTKFAEGDQWRLLEEKHVDRLPAGYVITRDYVSDPMQLGLLDEHGWARPCFYRIEVEQGGQVHSEEGYFDPNTRPGAPGSRK